MKWTVRAFACPLLLWCAYFASPYVALYRLGTAVLAGDRAAVAKRVDMVAVRRALASDIILAVSGGRPSTSGMPSLASVAAFIADPLIAEYVTEDAIVELMRGGASNASGSQALGSVPVLRLSSVGEALQLFARSEHRGLTKVAFRLPLDEPRSEQYGLLFRLSGFRWRLSAVELPERTKQRIVDEALKKRADARG
jgi:hypothetical protein